jgi:hypothetical protein
LNAFAERWVRSVKEECLSHLILFGERSLWKALIQFQEHYHQERNHQGKSNALLFPPLLRLRPVGDVASAVENVLAAYSDTTVAPHEYFDQTGACVEDQRVARRLRIRNVDVGRGALVHLPVADIAHDPDHLGAIEAALPDADVLADWVFARPKSPCCGIAYQHHLRRTLPIGVGEHAPTQQRNLHRFEISGRCPVHADKRLGPLWHGRAVAKPDERAVATAGTCVAGGGRPAAI